MWTEFLSFCDVLVRSQANLHFDRENVEQRQQTLNSTYIRLCKLGQVSLDDTFYQSYVNRHVVGPVLPTIR